MPTKIYCLSIDCADPARLARFWAAVLDFNISFEVEGEVAIEGSDGSSPISFFKVPDHKVVKNRLHLDLNPHDQAAEVKRLIGLGAKEVDIGQGEVSWVVMADPEGNEFCVLTAR